MKLNLFLLIMCYSIINYMPISCDEIKAKCTNGKYVYLTSWSAGQGQEAERQCQQQYKVGFSGKVEVE